MLYSCILNLRILESPGDDIEKKRAVLLRESR
jgi:hypothetical protein